MSNISTADSAVKREQEVREDDEKKKETPSPGPKKTLFFYFGQQLEQEQSDFPAKNGGGEELAANKWKMESGDVISTGTLVNDLAESEEESSSSSPFPLRATVQSKSGNKGTYT